MMARRYSRREWMEREARRVRQLEAAASARSLARRIESGEQPSAVYQGRRLPVMKVQDHPVAGRRYLLNDGIIVWRLAADVSDPRGVESLPVHRPTWPPERVR